MLCTLSSAPFQPLETAICMLEAITYKTFVLIALALGTRRGELCALRRGQFVRPAEDQSFVLLYSDPSFIPKMAKGRFPTEPYKLQAPSIPPPPPFGLLRLIWALGCSIACFRSDIYLLGIYQTDAVLLVRSNLTR